MCIILIYFSLHVNQNWVIYKKFVILNLSWLRENNEQIAKRDMIATKSKTVGKNWKNIRI